MNKVRLLILSFRRVSRQSSSLFPLAPPVPIFSTHTPRKKISLKHQPIGAH